MGYSSVCKFLDFLELIRIDFVFFLKGILLIIIKTSKVGLENQRD
jgi:hypothetical protein